MPLEPRILHIVGDSCFGGGTFVILQLAKAARMLGWRPFVLTTDLKSILAYRDMDIGVIREQVLWRSIRPLRDIRGLIKLVRLLRRERFDIVHTHTSKGGFVGRLAAWLAGTPVIVHTCHGFAFHEQSSWTARTVYSAMERLAAHWCHAIVCVSEFHARWALQLGIGGPGKILSIPNGVPPASICPAGTRESIRQSLGIAPRSLVLFSMGRLAAQKGLAWLIDAVPLIRESISEPVVALIAGEGPLLGELRGHAARLGLEDSVRFLGFRADITELLAASDIVVLPSLWEGLSVALLEAMRAGRPIVTTTIESNLEVASHGDVALLVPSKDSAALASAVLQLAGDEALCRHLAAESHRVLTQFYDEARPIAAYRDLYAALAAQHLEARRTPALAAT